jgi:ATPase subunit of ABC transporter with duplicated ATPase domains
MESLEKTEFEKYLKTLTTLSEKIGEIISWCNLQKPALAHRGAIKGVDYAEQTKKLASTSLEYIEKEVSWFRVITENRSDVDKYNQQYKNFLITRMSNVTKEGGKVLSLQLIPSTSFNEIFLYVQQFERAVKRDSKFNIFEQFKFGDKNYVLFGKNGSGKTTLLKKLSAELLNVNAIVIPATRKTNYKENKLYSDQEAKLQKAIICDEEGKALFLLSKCAINREIEQRREHKDDKDTITYKAMSIFSNLGIDRSLKIAES